MFLHHEACEKCGSSDGKAVYQGGSTWCFVCKSYSRGNVFHEPKKKEARSLPTDLSQHYPREVIDWISKYEITVEDLIRENVSYSEYTRGLYFSWKDEEGRILGWQARSFKETGPKYISSGNLEQCLPIVYHFIDTEPSRHVGVQFSLVLVEDCLSAIKVAKTAQVDAMACLTSSLSTAKLNRLVRLYGTFLVWLDGDMFDNAQKMAEILQLLGAKARAVYTPHDPKCYSGEELRNICNSALT